MSRALAYERRSVSRVRTFSVAPSLQIFPTALDSALVLVITTSPGATDGASPRPGVITYQRRRFLFSLGSRS